MPRGRKSDSQRDLVALQLARGVAIAKAAAKGGACARTVSDWLANDEEFRARVQELRNQLIDRTISTLAGAAVKAVRTLIQLTAPEQKPAIRVRAAKEILATLFRGMELVEMQGKLDEIEARLPPLVGIEVVSPTVPAVTGGKP